MSTDNTAAGMPKTIDPKEVLWGRQGLGPGYFGPELIAEALWEVLNTTELLRLRNFAPFLNAFVRHSPSDCRVNSIGLAEINSKFQEQHGGLEWLLGVGSFGTSYGLVSRQWVSGTRWTPHWVTKEEWDQVTQASDETRKSQQDYLPPEQVERMINERVFLSRKSKLVVMRCVYKASGLNPEGYLPYAYLVEYIDVHDGFDLTQEGVLAFCQKFGARAGAALLEGLSLQLQSTNYQVRQELKANEAAEAMAKRLLTRI